jgi:hypothetical protein
MEHSKALAALSAALRDIHRHLIEGQRRTYEKEWGKVAPGELLQLLTRHPDFEWLHALSELIVMIDEAQDDEAHDDAMVKSLYGEAAKLITQTGAAPAEGFAQRYLATLQNDVALVAAQAAARKVLASI